MSSNDQLQRWNQISVNRKVEPISYLDPVLTGSIRYMFDGESKGSSTQSSAPYIHTYMALSTSRCELSNGSIARDLLVTILANKRLVSSRCYITRASVQENIDPIITKLFNATTSQLRMSCFVFLAHWLCALGFSSCILPYFCVCVDISYMVDRIIYDEAVLWLTTDRCSLIDDIFSRKLWFLCLRACFSLS